MSGSFGRWYRHREAAVGTLRQPVVDRVVVAPGGDVNVAGARQVRGAIERAGGDRDGVAPVGLPEECRTALAAEAAARGIGRFVPAQLRLARQAKVTVPRGGRRHEVAGIATALRAVAVDDRSQGAGDLVADR